MKALSAAVALFVLLVLGAPDLRAQVYAPYYAPYADIHYPQYLQYQHYLQWQQYLEYLRLTDPYYDLHVMHYQLYLRPYQPYQIYQPCCYAFGIPRSSPSFARAPKEIKNRSPHSVRRK